jgi:hypothetical protein
VVGVEGGAEAGDALRRIDPDPELRVTAADLDRDWALFDNKRLVTLRIRGPDDALGSPQTVDALEVPREVYDEDGGDGAKLAEDSRMIPLRASQVAGTVTPRSQITDWNGTVRVVQRAKLVSWGTRWQCWCN